MPIVYATSNDRARYEAHAAALGHHPTGGVALDGPPVAARVDHGRWLADCPWCRSAILVAPGDPFWCPDCGNAPVHGQDLQLVWPSERAAIDAALDRRLPINRHWFPDESVEDLELENECAAVVDGSGLTPHSQAWRHAFAAEFNRRKHGRR